MAFSKLGKSQAQSLSEYAIVLGIVASVFLVMQVYMKRGIQAVIKVAADEIGQQKEAEEIDIEKGTYTESLVRRVSSGKPKNATELPDLDEGSTQRIGISKDGSQRRDTYTTSEVRPLLNEKGQEVFPSYSIYISKSEE